MSSSGLKDGVLPLRQGSRGRHTTHGACYLLNLCRCRSSDEHKPLVPVDCRHPTGVRSAYSHTLIAPSRQSGLATGASQQTAKLSHDTCQSQRAVIGQVPSMYMRPRQRAGTILIYTVITILPASVMICVSRCRSTSCRDGSSEKS